MMKRPSKKEITAWIDHHLADPRLEPEALLHRYADLPGIADRLLP